MFEYIFKNSFSILENHTANYRNQMLHFQLIIFGHIAFERDSTNQKFIQSKMMMEICIENIKSKKENTMLLWSIYRFVAGVKKISFQSHTDT